MQCLPHAVTCSPRGLAGRVTGCGALEGHLGGPRAPRCSCGKRRGASAQLQRQVGAALTCEAAVGGDHGLSARKDATASHDPRRRGAVDSFLLGVINRHRFRTSDFRNFVIRSSEVRSFR